MERSKTQRFVVCAAVLLSLVPVASFGQDTRESVSASDEAIHDAIRELRDSLIDAVNNRDVETLLSLLHEEFVLTAQDGEELATIRGREGVRDYVNRLLTGPDAGVKDMTVDPVVDELTILHGDDTGIAYGHSTDQYTLRDGSQFTLNTRWSATLVKGDAGQWQLASLHVSTNLFDNPVLDMLKQYSLIISIATGFAGLMIGILGTKMLNSTPNNSPVPKE
ncbi:MAG: nuclear transport factor 2 family protein [Planctomycetaceae bacterium]